MFFSGIGAITFGVLLDIETEATALLVISGSYALFEGVRGYQKFRFKMPWSAEEIQKIRLYYRHPMGLSASELQFLENYYNGVENE